MFVINTLKRLLPVITSMALILAVSTIALGAELLSWSKERSPYKEGVLGVIKPGVYADLLIVDGNPEEDISVLVDYENNFKVIMKDGKVYKNTL